MSDEKIDHAAEAAMRLTIGATDAAQVHATLALVEQQRIANLIALAQFGGEVSGEAMVGLTENVPHSMYDTLTVPALRPEIRKGLGL